MPNRTRGRNELGRSARAPYEEGELRSIFLICSYPIRVHVRGVQRPPHVHEGRLDYHPRNRDGPHRRADAAARTAAGTIATAIVAADHALNLPRTPESAPIVRADRDLPRDVLGRDYREAVRLRGAVDRGHEEYPARPQQRLRGAEEGRRVGHVLDDLQGRDYVEQRPSSVRARRSARRRRRRRFARSSPTLPLFFACRRPP